MSTEYGSESETAELRKRAAVLLGMLVLVAALLVVIFLTFFNNSSGGSRNAGPTGSIAVGPTPPSTPSGRTTARTSTGPGASTGSTGSTDSGSPLGPPSCPTSSRCIVPGDGGTIAAINAYRAANGKSAASGTVSAAAQRCALTDGGDCAGSWAESQVPDGTAAAAIGKVRSLGKLLADYRSFAVGWAYDPGSKQYFFAVIRTG